MMFPMILVATLGACGASEPEPSPDPPAVEEPAPVEAEKAPPPTQILETVVEQGDSFSRLLEKMGVVEVQRTVDEIAAVFDPRRLRFGQTVTWTRDMTTGFVVEMRYDIAQGRTLRVTWLENGDIVAVNDSCKRVAARRSFTAKARESLWAVATQSGFTANDIGNLLYRLRYDVDPSDVGEGDRFVVAGEVCREEPEGSFQVMRALSFTPADEAEDADAGGVRAFCLPRDTTKALTDCDYYRKDFSSVDLGRSFLRSPLDPKFRWGSGYNPRRVDPIHGRIVAHRAVDIGAPTGTPVVATGDGTVIYSGTRGGYGKFVKIDHGTHDGKKIMTAYAHHSALLVKKGQRVKQGDVIGKVGSTGHSTSPHVHYEYIVNGKQVDPAKVALPKTNERVPDARKSEFQEVVSWWAPQLDPNTTIEALPVEPSPSVAPTEGEVTVRVASHKEQQLPSGRFWTRVLLEVGREGGTPSTAAVWLSRPWQPGVTFDLPLVVVLPGWSYSATLWDDKGALGEAAEAAGVVVVAPEMSKSVYEHVWYPEAQDAYRYAKGDMAGGAFVLDGVMPWASGLGRLIGTMGLSTGGRGAVVLAQRWTAAGKPALAAACSISGTYDLMSLDAKTGEYRIHEKLFGARDTHAERWRQEDILPYASRLAGTRVRLAHGERDRVVPLEQQQSFVRALEDAGVTVNAHVVDKGGHDWSLWSSETKPCLDYIVEASRWQVGENP